MMGSLHPASTRDRGESLQWNVARGSAPIAADSTRVPSPVRDGAKGSSAEPTRSERRDRFTRACETCQNRRYQDGSTDAGVSYKTPTRIGPNRAASAVAGHEREHVVRERAKAQREGREVVSQSVTLHNAVCPECGRVYVSGGTTRTTTRTQQQAERFQVGQSKPPNEFCAVA